MVVCFFGHRDAPNGVYERLYGVLCDLIEKEGAMVFYCGRQGNFDGMAIRCLKELKKEFPWINYSIVLENLSSKGESEIQTVYPEGLEGVPPKFAIDRRNRWMVEQSDVVVTYVWRTFGGAAKFKDLALRKGKRVIELNK